MKHIKRFICRLVGHEWRPYNGDFYEPYCVRCGKHPGFIQIVREAAEKRGKG